MSRCPAWSCADPCARQSSRGPRAALSRWSCAGRGGLPLRLAKGQRGRLRNVAVLYGRAMHLAIQVTVALLAFEPHSQHHRFEMLLGVHRAVLEAHARGHHQAGTHVVLLTVVVEREMAAEDHPVLIAVVKVVVARF